MERSKVTDGTIAVVSYTETAGWPDGVFLFSSLDEAEDWMQEQIRKHGGDHSHLSVDAFQSAMKPHEDFYIMDLHDMRQ